MNAHIEKEYKMLLNKEEYISLLNNIDSNTYKQANYYYSSSSKIASFRIREIENKYIFTLKVKENDYHREYEFEISDNSLNDERISDLFKEFNISEYRYVGELITYRTDLKLSKGIISLDKNEYLGVTDYEIEYELYNYQDGDNSELINLLKKCNIKYIPNTITKRKRFGDVLKED